MVKLKKYSQLYQLKVFSAFAIMLFFVLAGVIAENSDVIDMNNVANETKVYIEKFLKQEAIEPNEINAIQKIDLGNPPDDVKIKNVDDAAIDIYQVNYTQGTEDKKIYVVSYATTNFIPPAETLGLPPLEYLHFGENALSNGTIYLKTAAGVRSSAEQGYVMIDSGSITGLSTNLNIVNSGEGNVHVIIYKNGESTGLRNTFDASKSGIEKDYDSQSPDVVIFVPGDIISVVVEAPESISWDDVITMVKVELK